MQFSKINRIIVPQLIDGKKPQSNGYVAGDFAPERIESHEPFANW
jgi:hypothetical protein